MKNIESSVILIAGIVVIAMSFINIIIQIIKDEEANIWLITTILGLILLAMSGLLSEMKSQTLILKNIEKKDNVSNKKTGEK